MTIEIFADFETRSKASGKDVGAAKYAAHESTLPLMFAYGSKFRGHSQWVLDLESFLSGKIPVCPEDLRELIANPEVQFHAHNSAFEIYVYRSICVERWGWPAIPNARWYCTAAKGSAANMPRALDNLCLRLEVGEDSLKDKTGKLLIKQLSVPQKALKTRGVKSNGTIVDLADGKPCNTRSVIYLNEAGVETFDGKDPKGIYFWDNDPEAMDAFAKYNLQDIVAEETVDRRLPNLPDFERRLWLLDRKINEKGFPIDRELCEAALKIYEVEVDLVNKRLEKVAFEIDAQPKDRVERCSQSKRILNWVNDRVDFGDSLEEDFVNDWLKKYDKKQLEHEDPYEVERVREVLNLRQMAGGTAVKKYKAALAYVQKDGRAREQLMYYGAATGRWTGKGIQPHNFKRAATPDESYIDAIKTENHEIVSLIADMYVNDEGESEPLDVIAMLKKCVRGLIRAPEGKKLVVSDFAGIESRVLNWFCKNERSLELIRNGDDLYLDAACSIYNCKLEDIAYWHEGDSKWKVKKAHKEKRQIGKIACLALGYGMGWSTFQETARKDGQILDETFSRNVVGTWRRVNYQIPEMWRRVEDACKEVIRGSRKRQRKSATIEGLVRVYWDPRGYLCIELPSGRVLYYYKAKIDFESGQIMYLGGSKKDEKSAYVTTYGEKLVENIIQAISRDILMNSMFIIDDAGIDLIGHVHDEVIAEVDKDDPLAFGIVHEAMETLPTWAIGLPLGAETYEAERYTK